MNGGRSINLTTYWRSFGRFSLGSFAGPRRIVLVEDLFLFLTMSLGPFLFTAHQLLLLYMCAYLIKRRTIGQVICSKHYYLDWNPSSLTNLL